MSIIRLDLDNITFEKLEKKIDLIKLNPMVKEILVSESCKMSGYHIEIETFWKIKKSAVFHLRYLWGDDTRRLVRDMLEIGNDLLFNFKLESIMDENHKVLHSHLWERTEMFKYIRETQESEWHLTKIKKKYFQTSTVEHLQSVEQLSVS